MSLKDEIEYNCYGHAVLPVEALRAWLQQLDDKLIRKSSYESGVARSIYNDLLAELEGLA